MWRHERQKARRQQIGKRERIMKALTDCVTAVWKKWDSILSLEFYLCRLMNFIFTFLQIENIPRYDFYLKLKLKLSVEFVICISLTIEFSKPKAPWILLSVELPVLSPVLSVIPEKVIGSRLLWYHKHFLRLHKHFFLSFLPNELILRQSDRCLLPSEHVQ